MNEKQWKVSKESLVIGQAMTAGVLLEISCEPSPGLVSPNSMGAHKDMNIISFLLSSAAIAPYFSIFAEMGLNCKIDSQLLENIRPLGIEAEKEFLNLTNQVNTQRGILFLGGIVAAAAGYATKTGERNMSRISEKVAVICKGIIEKELVLMNANKKKTHGENLYIKYGLTGIRGEVEKGLPSVREIGYPVFKNAVSNGMGINDAMVHTLLHLFSHVEDTTVASRVGIEGLKKCREASQEVLEKGGMQSNEGRRAALELDRYFIKQNISPGGCADLLAVTVGIYLMEGHSLKPESIIG
ncbi:MAG: triphosphoribosyl-dephospho-CoA synthase CitG [Tindallia sp. MSAO_Bac2]|nr:MAG: triphosphoribosyl-dephospho-CoA synthase CitG [Tindallia sp. MSAO_Bac2]